MPDLQAEDMKYKYPLVEIVWDDAETDPSWRNLSDVNPKHALVVTVGFLIKETEKHIVIASTYSEEAVIATIQIPVGMIVKRTVRK